ncbi:MULTISPECIES: hypothetical protein [unclassified Cellulophaga]|uniref:hypothetical protein n=1 Tax=unclassified Cellulophaga TaxID=2634405 RepID=UPI003868456E
MVLLSEPMIALMFSEGLAGVSLNGRSGFIDNKGNVIMEIPTIKKTGHEVESYDEHQ